MKQPRQILGNQAGGTPLDFLLGVGPLEREHLAQRSTSYVTFCVKTRFNFQKLCVGFNLTYNFLLFFSVRGRSDDVNIEGELDCL